jgi:glutamine synthetase
VINTIVAEVLSRFADELEKAPNFTDALNALIKRTIKEHRRIIFNGNNYSQEWIEKAERRGLLNLKSTSDALPCFISDKNIALFTRHHILSRAEILSRYEILMEGYCKILNIEAQTMIEMVRKEVLPAVFSYMKILSETALAKKRVLPDMCCEAEEDLLKKLAGLSGLAYRRNEALEQSLLQSKEGQPGMQQDMTAAAKYFSAAILPAMKELREAVDGMESLVGEGYWPYPTYGDILFKV